MAARIGHFQCQVHVQSSNLGTALPFSGEDVPNLHLRIRVQSFQTVHSPS